MSAVAPSLGDGETNPLQAPPELLRVVTAGSVDDGKSTLIGRLLHDTKSILEDQLDAVERTSRERGDGRLDLALLTDGLRAEREQGITIDVAYRFFSTPKRSFILADTPGHVAYTRNMVTGASSAELAIVLIDARQGVVEQSKRHASIAAMLRVPHVVACVNKMDLVDWDEPTFERIATDFREFAARLGIPDVAAIPVSALKGDNVVERSSAAPWYDGPALLSYLEQVDIATDRRQKHDLRFPIQWVVRPHDDAHHDYRGYAGQVAGGVLRVGDEVDVLPAGHRTRVTALDTFDGPVEEAFPPMSVTVRLEDDLDVSRGDVLCHPATAPRVARSLEATVCWLDERPGRPGARYLIKQAASTNRVRLERLTARTDVETLAEQPDPAQLSANDLGRVTIAAARPLVLDRYGENRGTGAFILIDEATNATVAAGMVLEPIGSASGPQTANVVWESGGTTAEARWNALGHRGATVWLTGLPASGKSTVAAAYEKQLLAQGRPAYLVDGDNLRHGLCGDLGFDAASRTENVRRAGEAALLLAEAGTVALVALVSPYAADRDAVRARHAEAGVPFVEVHVATPLEECERRDPKGLYRRARAGELPGLTGIDDPYEPPPSPELVLNETGSGAADELDGALASAGALDPPAQ
jgi:bifunctional enzyme CysN/CysC